jgi:Fe-S-cluster-containing dehydrogenase component
VLKCDLCAERLAAGAEPACVVACPTRALVALEEADVNRAKRRQTAVALVASRKE